MLLMFRILFVSFMIMMNWSEGEGGGGYCPYSDFVLQMPDLDVFFDFGEGPDNNSLVYSTNSNPGRTELVIGSGNALEFGTPTSPLGDLNPNQFCCCEEAGFALGFDRTAGAVLYSQHTFPLANEKLSFTFWVKIYDDGPHAVFTYARDDQNANYIQLSVGRAAISFKLESFSQQQPFIGTERLSLNAWYYFCFVRETTTGNKDSAWMYRDGQIVWSEEKFAHDLTTEQDGILVLGQSVSFVSLNQDSSVESIAFNMNLGLLGELDAFAIFSYDLGSTAVNQLYQSRDCAPVMYVPGAIDCPTFKPTVSPETTQENGELLATPDISPSQEQTSSGSESTSGGELSRQGEGGGSVDTLIAVAATVTLYCISLLASLIFFIIYQVKKGNQEEAGIVVRKSKKSSKSSSENVLSTGLGPSSDVVSLSITLPREEGSDDVYGIIRIQDTEGKNASTGYDKFEEDEEGFKMKKRSNKDKKKKKKKEKTHGYENMPMFEEGESVTYVDFPGCTDRESEADEKLNLRKPATDGVIHKFSFLCFSVSLFSRFISCSISSLSGSL